MKAACRLLRSSRKARTVVVAIVALLLVGCGSTATPTPPVSVTGPTPTPTPTPVPGSALLAPFAAGQTGQVIEGYNVAPQDRPCQAGNPPDHCGNQRDGLDITPSDQVDKRILAPVAGTIALILPRTDPSAGPCLLLRTDDDLNLNICHFDEKTISVSAGDHVDRGCVLGLRDTSWIHLSLDDRYRDPRKPPVAFTAAHNLEGVSYPEKDLSIRDQYRDSVMTSTNHPRDCGQNPTPTPTPTPTLTPRPTPTPSPTPTPAAARWVKTGSMHMARGQFGAVLLAGGKVLVVGDDNICTPGGAWPGSEQSEVWDPSTKRWSRTSDRSTPRDAYVVVALDDGRAILAGGVNDDMVSLGLASIYDPAADKWIPAHPMLKARMAASGALLPDGRVLVAGGYWTDGNQARLLASSEIYDPRTDRWSKGPALPEARYDAQTATLADGRILLVGGEKDLESTAPASIDAVLYDPATKKWLTTGLAGRPRGGYSLMPLQDGGALIAGGYIEGKPALSALRLDPESLRWTKTGAMVKARTGAAATLLTDGRVLVAGGDKRAKTSTAEIYDPRSGKWTRTANLPIWRDRGAAVALPDGTALVIGGSNGVWPEAAPSCPGMLTTTYRFYPGAP